ncbi:MAG TPA: RNA polymerase sigma factor [Acidisarcina sp.]
MKTRDGEAPSARNGTDPGEDLNAGRDFEDEPDTGDEEAATDDRDVSSKDEQAMFAGQHPEQNADEPSLDEADPDDLDRSETADLAQPLGGNGVGKGMASLALGQMTDRRSWEHTSPGEKSWQGARPALASGRSRSTVIDGVEVSDSEIMLRVREGDDSGYTYLIEKYRKPILHYMFRMVRNQAIAEELAQEVFLRVYRSRASYRAEAQFSTWLYRIATNLGVNHARDHKHEKAAQNVYLDQADPETGLQPDLADPRATVELELVKDERMRAIREHVLALPERQRNAVLMHKYQGMDYKEIGKVLKLSESATKSLLFRAYQTLRERLKDFAGQP